MTDYGDGPERGNAQTWAFMAAECARLLRERDEARREVKRLREIVTAARDVANCDAEDWHDGTADGRLDELSDLIVRYDYDGLLAIHAHAEPTDA